MERRPLGDTRGFFERFFCTEELREIFQARRIEQINHTLTAQAGTVRGLHFQFPPDAEMKVVSCVRGEVFDVAVDLRKGSPTFLKWHGEILSESNHRTLIIPEGFAHGFQTLTDNCEMFYLHTMPYRQSNEGAVNCADPKVGVEWPLPISQLSERDRNHPFLDDSFKGI